MTEKELQMQQKKEVQQSGEPTRPIRQFVPSVDIYESSDTVGLFVEMPGVDYKGIDIDLDDGTLTITGTMKDMEIEDENILMKEYESGQYVRKFSISETIDQEKITASMRNGMLKLTLPKVEPAKPRKIDVKAY